MWQQSVPGDDRMEVMELQHAWLVGCTTRGLTVSPGEFQNILILGSFLRSSNVIGLGFGPGDSKALAG